MNDKEFTYKLTKETLDATCDFITGWFIVMLLMLPMMFL